MKNGSAWRGCRGRRAAPAVRLDNVQPPPDDSLTPAGVTDDRVTRVHQAGSSPYLEAQGMKTDDLARWMREEHLRVRELTDLLRSEITSQPRTQVDDWLARFRDRFEHLRAHLQKHFALEEQGGYLPTVLERRPTLSESVERLRHEHNELSRMMDGIHLALGAVAPEDQTLIRDCCRRVENLLVEVCRHEADENLILMTVVTRDIGAND